MLHLAKEFKYIDEEKYTRLLNNSIEISKMISGLFSKIQ
ncbi:MAG: four helix bundle protein [Ignavibacteria bacterium]|nr:four helix bundle protein [Ignavibacteria bacterium]